MKRFTSPLAILILLLGGSVPLHADVVLPPLFSDHMVLQRSAATPVWGKADSGEEVTVSVDGKSATARADEAGRWKVQLDLKSSAAGPFEMVVSGRNRIAIPDVVVGEVWVASGQSNMEWILKNTLGAEKEIAGSADPLMRHFTVVKASLPTPADDCQGKWVVAGPEASGGFSAVGYFFAKALRRELAFPVGIINASWGGSCCEAWLGEQGFDRDPILHKGAQRRWDEAKAYPSKKQRFAADFADWLKANGREDHPTKDTSSFAGETVSSEGWVPVQLPGLIAGDGIPKSGAVWVRKNIDLPPQPASEKFLLELGEIQGFESVFWNGQPLKETTPASYPGAGFWRRMEVPSSLLKVGRNTIAIRVFAPTSPAKFLIPAANFKAEDLPLSGEWMARGEYELPASDAAKAAPAAPHNPPRAQDIAAQLFNGMIHPLVPYGIRGVIWYQGEANTNRAAQYRATFASLIGDWRSKWQNPDLPFYHCQLANYQAKQAEPSDSAWAELREAQSQSLDLAHTGEAVLIDLGDAGDIHPRGKVEVGERLARLALAKDYGKNVAFSGPTYRSSKIDGPTVRLTFQNADGGLVARPLPERYSVKSVTGTSAPLARNSPRSELEGFALCGEDRQWHWAEARIEGDNVVVSSQQVPKPIAVRYAWADNPTGNLYNGAGLPASPFRTDDFPSLTRAGSY